MFRGIRYVYAVYKEMSFSKAARSLYISQPSLSAAVKKEEEELGFPIFDRSSSPVRLTEVGREYIRAAERILEIQQGFADYINDVSGLKTGSVSIGGTNLFASYVLPPILSGFSEKYPLIEVDLVEGDAAELTEKLLRGSIDLLVENARLDPDVFESRLCCSEHLMLTVPKKFAVNEKAKAWALSAEQVKSGVHLDPGFPAVPLELFSGEQFLLLRQGNDSRSRADRLCAKAGFTPKIRLELGQQITAYNLSCGEMGISFSGDLLIRRVPSGGNMLFYKLDESEAARGICFYYKRSRYLTKAVREFLKLV